MTGKNDSNSGTKTIYASVKIYFFLGLWKYARNSSCFAASFLLSVKRVAKDATAACRFF
jgi:hypothetical protein